MLFHSVTMLFVIHLDNYGIMEEILIEWDHILPIPQITPKFSLIQ